jgi:hypothetical protein
MLAHRNKLHAAQQGGLGSDCAAALRRLESTVAAGCSVPCLAFGATLTPLRATRRAVGARPRLAAHALSASTMVPSRVVQSGRIAGGDRDVGTERRLEPRQRFERRATEPKHTAAAC